MAVLDILGRHDLLSRVVSSGISVCDQRECVVQFLAIVEVSQHRTARYDPVYEQHHIFGSVPAPYLEPGFD